MAWQTSDGQEFNNEYDAQSHQDNINSGGVAVAAASGGGGLLALIILFIPAIIAKIFGTIFAFLSKLGFVGKILQTVIVAAISFIITLFVTGLLPGDIFAVLALPVLIMVILWFWLYHHDEIKNIKVIEYSDYVAVSFSIVLYGTLVIILFASILANIFNDTVGSIIGLALLYAIFAWAIISYLLKTSSYREEIAKTRKNPKLKKMIMIIAAIYLGLSTISGFINLAFPDITKSINIDLTGRSSNSSFEIGSTIVVPGIILLKEPTYLSDFLKEIPKGAEVLVIGKTVKRAGDEFVHVEYEGIKGYLDIELLE